ncbi:uncharacterized protein LOC119666433 [Teleopsis dalmanni]|uniref:uncharacterized protein LOC119662492 n=1 Tax=Teleopsis dalmanni TaxID=139649 RepID=UPI0018CD470B|nr:uncharacterized protein LOC119662492 [Teleopsis dalmanni]XP_037931639.1 uncharacterized protein LOC119666433 [Teleopsis dalmanni]
MKCGEGMRSFNICTIKFYYLIFCEIVFWQQLVGLPYQGSSYYQKCTDSETKQELLIGDVIQRRGRCIRAQCLGTLEIWEDSCQIPHLPGTCSQLPPPNEFLDYPDCCPLHECKSYEFNENGETVETLTYDHHGILKKQNIIKFLVVVDHQKRNPNDNVSARFNI